MLDEHMEKLRNGYDDAIDDIYNETRKLVFSICLSYMRDYMLAEDMMQEAYIKVRNCISLYKKNTNPCAWIVTITKNICLNELKKRKKIDLIGDINNLDIEDVEKSDNTLLNIALKILNEKELQIVLSHVIDGAKLVDIEKNLRISEGTIRWKYNNALNKIRKYIERSENNAINK